MEQTDRTERLLLQHQLCFPLYAAARKVVSLYTPYLQGLQITYTQYIVLLVLWEKDGLTVGEIGKRLFLDNGTLTPMLKKMEENGIVERRRSKEDERKVEIYLTGKGEALREEAIKIPEQVGACLPLEEEEAMMLYQTLYRILENTRENPVP